MLDGWVGLMARKKNPFQNTGDLNLTLNTFLGFREGVGLHAGLDPCREQLVHRQGCGLCQLLVGVDEPVTDMAVDDPPLGR